MRAFALLVAAGLCVRAVLLAEAPGNTFDTESFRQVAAALANTPLDLYSLTGASGSVARWPYGSGYLPWVWLADNLSSVADLPFARVIRLPAVAADVGIATVLWLALRRTSPRGALVAAGLVLLGPSFVANSSAHGQVDAMAALFALVAVVLWERDVARRWLWCGGLVGLAAATKSPLGIVVLALIPTARDRREAITTVGATVAVPALLLAPWLLHERSAVIEALRYRGLPGVGGLSLLVEPALGLGWLREGHLTPLSGPSEVLQDLATPLIAVAAAVVGTAVYRARVAAPLAACALIAALWVAGVNFGLGYAVWGLPFLLLAGRTRDAVLLQLVLLPPIVMIYTIGAVDGWPAGVVYGVYVPCMLAVLFGAAYRLATARRS